MKISCCNNKDTDAEVQKTYQDNQKRWIDKDYRKEETQDLSTVIDKLEKAVEENKLIKNNLKPESLQQFLENSHIIRSQEFIMSQIESMRLKGIMADCEPIILH